MTTLTQTLYAVGGVLLLATPAPAKDSPTAAGNRTPAARLAQAGGAQDQRAQRGARGVPGRPGGPPVTERFERSIRLGAKDGFELATGFGDVTITGVPGDLVTVDAVKRVRHPNRDAGMALLQAVAIRLSDRGGLVEVVTDAPRTNFVVFIDYTVTLPTRASVSIKTFGGTIRVTNVKGELRAEAASGDMVITSVGSIRKAKTFAGSITISDADAEGAEVNAETIARGTLQVRNVRARTIELGTAAGALLVTDAQCDRCTVKSVSGDIEFAGPLTRGGRYELQSQSGDVRLYPAANASFDLEAKTFGGQIRNDFPLTRDPAMPQRPNIVRGSYGEGGAILSLTSFSGSVSVLRK